MEKVDTLVVDKTGTLTEGRPKVVHIEAAPGFSADDVLQKLASVERASEHPLAMAIVMDAQERKLALSPVTDFDSPVGKGVVGTVDGAPVVSGSAKFLAEHAIDTCAAWRRRRRRSARRQPRSSSSASAASWPVSSRSRTPSRRPRLQALQALRAAGVRIVMLTGDGKTTAEAVGRQLGIDEVVAEVFPEDKAAVVQRLQAEGRVVAMAGDGVNDAPGPGAGRRRRRHGHRHRRRDGERGHHAAQGRPAWASCARGRCRARRCATSAQNLFLSFAYNVAGIPLAAGVLYPFFGLLLSPVVAAAAMALSSVSVIANSLRLRSASLE